MSLFGYLPRYYKRRIRTPWQSLGIAPGEFVTCYLGAPRNPPEARDPPARTQKAGDRGLLVRKPCIFYSQGLGNSTIPKAYPDSFSKGLLSLGLWKLPTKWIVALWFLLVPDKVVHRLVMSLTDLEPYI